MTAAWLGSLAIVMGACAAGAATDVRPGDDLPCIPGETRCESASHMSVCDERGLAREVVACADGEVCLGSRPGAACEALPSNARTLRQNFDATVRVDLPSGGACTGFLVDDDVIVTNAHCCSDWHRCVDEGIAVTARYRGEDGSELSDSFVVASVVVVSEALDAAALRLSEAPGSRLGHVVLGAGRHYADAEVYVLGHPGGRPLEASLGIVYEYVDAIDYTYESGPVRKIYQVLYGARAAPGSSGSPVFLSSTHALVALHHSGGLEPHALGLESTDGFDSLLAGTDAEALGALLERSEVPVRWSARP